MSPFDAFLLFVVMIFLIETGHRLRAKRQTRSAAMESAIFALFGLLLAFTFSGAVSRYDAHRQLIVEESNDIGTAYLRLDLLPPASRPGLREAFRQYAEIRRHRFDELPNTPDSIRAAAETDRLQSLIWKESVAAAAQPDANPDATKLLLPALNAMFDITTTRRNAFNMHPPVIVYALLFLLAAGCALLAGYGFESSQHPWMYSVAFALVISATIYATLDIDFPRKGLIRLTSYDEIFTNLIKTMR